MKDVLFYEESSQVMYHYVKDLPFCAAHFFRLGDGWTTFTFFSIGGYSLFWIKVFNKRMEELLICYTSNKRPM